MSSILDSRVRRKNGKNFQKSVIKIQNFPSLWTSRYSDRDSPKFNVQLTSFFQGPSPIIKAKLPDKAPKFGICQSSTDSLVSALTGRAPVFVESEVPQVTQLIMSK